MGASPIRCRRSRARCWLFARDPGQFTNTRVIVVTEFGRSLFETPLGGTDDGDASVMMVLGPHDSEGGRVLGRFPGLATPQLSRQRNVAITIDLRQVVLRVAAGEPVLA